VVTGLYSLFLPLVAFAAFGSSRYMVVAADSATAAIFAGGVASTATPASAQYIALAGIVAVLTQQFCCWRGCCGWRLSRIFFHARCWWAFLPAWGCKWESPC